MHTQSHICRDHERCLFPHIHTHIQTLIRVWLKCWCFREGWDPRFEPMRDLIHQPMQWQVHNTFRDEGEWVCACMCVCVRACFVVRCPASPNHCELHVSVAHPWDVRVCMREVFVRRCKCVLEPICILLVCTCMCEFFAYIFVCTLQWSLSSSQLDYSCSYDSYPYPYTYTCGIYRNVFVSLTDISSYLHCRTVHTECQGSKWVYLLKSLQHNTADNTANGRWHSV